MDELIQNLTPEQALEAVRRLAAEGGEIREAILRQARSVLADVDLHETAEEVFFALDLIDVDECCERSGSRRNGYKSPDEAALEMMEEELDPFFEQAGRYHELGMLEEEKVYCMGVILGIYRFEQESKSEFKEWSVDNPAECADYLLGQWRKGCGDQAAAKEMDNFIKRSCPQWAGYMIHDS